MSENSIMEQLKLLQTVIEQQQAYIQAENALVVEKDARMAEKDETIAELRRLVDELQSLKTNLEETLHEFKRQLFGTASEKTISQKTDTEEETSQEEKTAIRIKEHTRERKPKSRRNQLHTCGSI